ncbi:four helix bundle protein [Candidatus Gottesmanbacteria bacterium]|nr:four helix bundle protein [Candidatus Gottesmanbacteria bacterium]
MRNTVGSHVFRETRKTQIVRVSEKSEIQMKRAGKSIPANIAEGFAKRKSEAEFKRFLKIAIGSSDEVISHLRALAMNEESCRKLQSISIIKTDKQTLYYLAF